MLSFLATMMNSKQRFTTKCCQSILLVHMGLLSSFITPSSDAAAQDKTHPIDYSSELPRVPALEPKEAIKKIEVAEGFEIQLVASEPLVSSPVAIEWDAKGGMFVCEMRGYSENRDDAISRVRYLTDTDQDGIYDHATVFADKLLWPTAIFPYKGGLFVADAPDIFYYKDFNNDGVADERKHVLTGFGFSNVQGLFNSFRWGLDNRIHVACSSVGGMVHPPDNQELAINVRGRDLAFDPDTYALTLTSGGAQHGMCFDDWGRKFVSSNSDHIQQVIYEDHYLSRSPFVTAPSSRRSIAADGPQAPVFRISPVEPWRIVRTRLRVGGVVAGPVEGGGRPSGYFTGATGITIYRGDNWSEEYRGMAIVGDVGSNLIHRKRIEQKSIEMIARRIDPSSEFVRSSDIWFRPAQFANAPDGTLHVVDVCREVIEHPKSLPPEIKQHLDLNSGRDKGRIYRIMRQGSEPRTKSNLNQLSDEDLVAMLQHPNAWHRETAARLLYEHQNIAVTPLLLSMAQRGSNPQARVHAFYVLRGIGGLTTEILLAGLADPHPQVRKHALRLTETHDDREQLHSAITKLVEDTDIEVRYQLAFSLGEFNHPRKSEILSRLAAQDSNSPWIRLAILSSVGDEAEAVFSSLIANQAFRSPDAAETLTKLSQMITRSNNVEKIAAAQAMLPQLTDGDPIFALPILGIYRAANLASGSGSDAFQNAFQQLIDEACDRATNPKLSISERSAACKALSFGDWDQIQPTLGNIIEQKVTPSLTDRALEVASKFQQPIVSTWLTQDWNHQTPERRKMVIEAMFARVDRTRFLFNAITTGNIPMSDIPRSRYTEAANSRDPDVKQQALNFLRQTATVSREEVHKNYQDALSQGGDASKGLDVFRKNCAACHRVEDHGYELGPNLAAVKAKGVDAILANILEPNLEVNPQYINYVLLKSDGTTATGMIASENATSVTLKRGEGATEVILREDIEEMRSSRKSIMPEELEKAINPSEMTDLITYLMTVN